MKKTRFTDEQTVTILREADQRPVPEVAKKHGINGQTIYAWRKHFGTLEAADVKRVAYAQGRGLSSRRACALLSVARSALGYASRLATRDQPVVDAMRELAGQYPRYGYRKVRIFRARQGHRMSADRAYRLWRQAGLQVPCRRPRRRVATSRPRPLPPTGLNHVWAYRLRLRLVCGWLGATCLTIVDEFTRECLGIDAAGSIRSGRVIEILSRLVSVHGAPRYLRSDNGPEFIATAILRWLQTVPIDTAFIDPGKPWQNAPTNRSTGSSATSA